MRSQDADELSRARLAFVSAGQPSLTAPRRAVPDEEPEPIDEPPPATSPRLSRTHLLAVAALLAVLVVIIALSYLRSAPEVVPAAPAIESIEPSHAPAPANSPEPPPEPQQIRIHVLGGVKEPGVVSLEAGAIVADAIAAAGGLAEDAQPGDLNLAAPVTAGMQVKVGAGGEESRVEGTPAADAGTAGGGDRKVNLNTATAGELESLPGVGPVMAGAIVAWREENGQFSSTAELQEISGIGPKTFAKLEPLVSVG